MTREEFQSTLHHLRWQEPFRPFTIELLTGEQIHIAELSFIFNNGFGVYFPPDEDDGIIEFSFDQVSRVTVSETTHPA